MYNYDKDKLEQHLNVVLNYANAALSSLIMRQDLLKEKIFEIEIEKFINSKKNEIIEWKIINRNKI